eukprot:1689011-Rhodomonas_salina.3
MRRCRWYQECGCLYVIPPCIIMLLRARYAMPGTHLPYALARLAGSRRAAPHWYRTGQHCSRIDLRAPYAMPGPDLPYNAL